MNNKEALVTFFLVIFSVSAVFLFPLVFIWSLNNLFNLGIEYTWKTWISTYVLLVVFGAIIKDQKKEDKIKTTDIWWKRL
jgi:hypothetical protein